MLFNWMAASPWFTAWQTHNFNLAIALICIFISVPLLMIGKYIERSVNQPKQKRRDELAQVVLQKVENDDYTTYFAYLRPFIVLPRQINSAQMFQV